MNKNSFVSFPISVFRIRSLFAVQQGFTLLEVMIAVSIISIAFITLLGSQSRSLSLATEARFNNVAPLLASAKLAEIESRSIVVSSEEGEFGDEFADFTWQLEAEDADLSSIESLDELDRPMQLLRLVVAQKATRFEFILTCYMRRVEQE